MLVDRPIWRKPSWCSPTKLIAEALRRGKQAEREARIESAGEPVRDYTPKPKPSANKPGKQKATHAPRPKSNPNSGRE